MCQLLYSTFLSFYFVKLPIGKSMVSLIIKYEENFIFESFPNFNLLTTYTPDLEDPYAKKHPILFFGFRVPEFHCYLLEF